MTTISCRSKKKRIRLNCCGMKVIKSFTCGVLHKMLVKMIAEEWIGRICQELLTAARSRRYELLGSRVQYHKFFGENLFSTVLSSQGEKDKNKRSPVVFSFFVCKWGMTWSWNNLNCARYFLEEKALLEKSVGQNWRIPNILSCWVCEIAKNAKEWNCRKNLYNHLKNLFFKIIDLNCLWREVKCAF